MTARFSNQYGSPADSNLRPHLNKMIFLTQASSKDTKKVGIDGKYVEVTRCVVSFWSMGGCDHKSKFPERKQPGGGGGGGGTRSGFIRGCAAPGSEPLPYFRESQTPKKFPILGKSHIPGTRSGPDSKNIPYFRENFIIAGTRSGPDSENIPYFREIS